MKVHKTEGSELDTNFTGEVPESITYHTPCHLRAQNIGLKSRDLMRLTGTKIKLVQQCSGIDGMWGLRAENAELSLPIAKKLGEMVRDANSKLLLVIAIWQTRQSPSKRVRHHYTRLR